MNESHPLSRPSSPGHERRHAPRYRARLESRLSFTLKTGDEPRGPDEPATVLSGYTRNLSETGLALILPSLPQSHQYLNRPSSDLRINLDLPTGEVRIDATPVYSLRLLGGDDGEGLLIGVRIRRMLDEEWVRLVQYVQRLAAESSESS